MFSKLCCVPLTRATVTLAVCTLIGVLSSKVAHAWVPPRSPLAGASLWSQARVAQIGPNSPLSEDLFGFSLAVDGGTVVIGAPGRFQGEGEVFVANRQGSGQWSMPTALPSLLGAQAEFGWDLAVSGNDLVASARLDSDANDQVGSVSFYERSGSVWDFKQTLNAGSPSASAEFGHAVAMLGQLTVVGEPGHNGAGGTRNNSGAAYLFRKNTSGAWQEVQKIEPPSPANQDLFGIEVAMTRVGVDVYAFVSATGRAGTQPRAGAVFVYRYNSISRSFAPLQTLTAPGAASDDQFGFALSASQDTLLVGAPGRDLNGSDSGAVFAYQRQSDGRFSLQAQFGAPSATTAFGYGIAVDQDRALVASAARGSTPSGRVYPVSLTNLRAPQVQTPLQPPSNAQGFFGAALAVTADHYFVGTVADAQDASSSPVTVYGNASASAPVLAPWALGPLGLGLWGLGRLGAARRPKERGNPVQRA